MRRVYVKESFGQAERITLSQETTHHLRDVLRLGENDRIRLFNDRGEWAEGIILPESKEKTAPMAVRIERRLEKPSHAPAEVILCCALMRGSRMDWVVEKCSEIGTHTIKPVLTERTVVKDPGQNKVSRWRRLTVAAAEQSGRGAPMVVEAPASFENVLDQVAKESLILLFHPEGDPAQSLSENFKSLPRQIAVFTGPEGGFTDQEIDSARRHGAKIIRLDNPVLRADTAAFLAAWTAHFLASTRSPHVKR